jgi:hypothetical protein
MEKCSRSNSPAAYSTWWWAASPSGTPGASWPSSRKGWSGSGCSCIPRRPGSSSWGALPARTAEPVGSSRRPSASRGSRISAGSTGGEGSSSGGTRFASGCAASSGRVKETIRRMMHLPIQDQGAYLKRVVNGFLNSFRPHQQLGYQLVLSPCRLVLVPRAAAAGPDKAADLGAHEAIGGPLAAAGTHPTSTPQRAVCVIDPRWKPGAVVPHAGFCAGGRTIVVPAPTHRANSPPGPDRHTASHVAESLVGSV